MKNWFKKIKDQTANMALFWQTTVIIFFIALIIILITSVVFWLKLEQDIAGSTNQNQQALKSNNLDTSKINFVLEQIKTRSADLASTTISLPTVTDPSR